MIELRTASGHPVSHILFSPDGATVAVAQPHYGVTLLDRTTGQARAVCALPCRALFTGLTFCGESRYLAAASAKGVEVFDTATGAAVATYFRPLCKQLRLADYNGEVIGSEWRVVRGLWRQHADGMFESNPVADEQKFTNVRALSPDGRLALVIAPMGRAALTDLTAGRTIAAVEYAEGTPFHQWPGKATFQILGRRFAINDGDTLAVYDASELEDERDDQYADAPPAVAPMPHGVLAPTFVLKPDRPADAGSWFPPFALAADGRGLLVKRPRNRVQLWDAPAGALVNEWSWRLEWVTCVAACADGQTAAAGGRFGRALLWDLD